MPRMRRENRQVKSGKMIREILEECQVARIGTSDRAGMFIVPVNFGYDFSDHDGKWELKLYFHGAMEGRKAEAFKANPAVAFEMDCRHQIIRKEEACGCSFAYRSIMGSGTIRLLAENDEKLLGLRKLMEHMAPGSECRFSPEIVERTAVYCVEAAEFSGKENPYPFCRH